MPTIVFRSLVMWTPTFCYECSLAINISGVFASSVFQHKVLMASVVFDDRCTLGKVHCLY